MMNTAGEIITFYSYKGGTGRSMALANVACLLARRPTVKRGVLAIDWDLEAPGLHRFFYPYLRPSQPLTGDNSLAFDIKPGVIDLFYELDSLAQEAKQPPEILAQTIADTLHEKYLLQTTIPNLFLLKAGCFDEKYPARVNAFQWESFYKRTPNFFLHFSQVLAERFDFILIDSRTGLNDTSGICTMLLPEKMVTVFTPNQQSLFGVIDLIKRATSYRQQSEDFRPLSVFPLASRVELSEPTLRELWRNGSKNGVVGYQPAFEKLFNDIYDLSDPPCNLQSYFDKIQIQHVPRYGYGEEIAVQVETLGDRLSLSKSYEFFADQLVRGANPWQIVDETQPVDEPSTTPHQLPAPPANFTGREVELKYLLQSVQIDGPAVVGIQGMGGIGKTALAIKLADILAPQFPDGQIFLDMKGTNKDDALTIIDAMKHVIVSFNPTVRLTDEPQQIASIYRSLLSGKKVLLVWDNISGGDGLQDLLVKGCLVVVTSRQRFAVPGLEMLDVDIFSQEEARSLIHKIAKRITDEQADEIAKLCGYLPLAIALVASTLAERPDLSPNTYIKRLRENQEASSLLNDSQTRLNRVEASIQLSYEGLREDLKLFFRELGVFPTSFDKTAAQSVWLIDEATTDDVLGELLRFSLLNFIPSSSRYEFHNLLRNFALSRMTTQEQDETFGRYSEYYFRILQTANALYLQGGENILKGLQLFDTEWHHISSAQHWASMNMLKSDSAARLCNSILPYCLELRLHPLKQLEWLESSLHASRILKDRHAEGINLGNLGLVHASLGDSHKAIEFYEQQLAIAREIGDSQVEGAALGNLGLAYADLGEPTKAIKFYEQQLIIARKIGDRRGEAADLGNLGNVGYSQGELAKAIEFYQQQLSIVREIGDRRGEGNALGNLGVAYADLGQPTEAIKFYEQQLAIAREIGDRRGEGNALGNLGLAYADLGEPTEAIQFYKEQLSIAHEIGDRRTEGVALGNLGNAYYYLEQLEDATHYYQQQLAIAREIGDRRTEGTALGNLGNTSFAQGDSHKAIQFYEQKLAITREINDRQGEAFSNWNLGTVYVELGEIEKAIAAMQICVKYELEIGHPNAKKDAQAVEELKKQLR